MNPKYSNFAVVVGAIAAVSIVDKIANVVTVIFRGYPLPRPIVMYEHPVAQVDDEGIESNTDETS